MGNVHSPLLFLFLATLTIINVGLISSSPPLPPSPTPLSPSSSLTLPPPPPSSSPILPPPPALPQQLNNIIDALIGAGDFASWVSILSMANPMILPLSATFFIPTDNTHSHHPAMDPLLFPYHIVPQRLTFSDLLLFKAATRLPTLLPGKSIFITNNSRSNFTLDNIPITHPDLYATATVAVHGVATILDYSVFGNGIPLFSSPPTEDAEPEVFTLPPPATDTLIGETIRSRSAAACLSTDLTIVVLVFFWVWTFKMQRNLLAC